jgi:hypothetical protein
MQLSTWLVTGVAAILLLELVIYLSGIVDSPRFDVDARIGYVPKPNQSGSFLHRNKWAFNDLRMGVSQPFRPMPDRVDLLLVGDSIVFGGNPYRPEQKLGASIERHSDWRVWPIGSGSWALQNELTYLAENPAAWQQVDRIVFVLNSGDFDEPSSWQTDLQHPRRYPWLATWYLVRRYLLNEQLPDPPMPVAAWPDLACRFEAFIAGAGKPVDLIFYPTRAELEAGRPCEIPPAFAKIGRWHCVGRDPRWSVSDYFDAIHPRPESVDSLGRIVVGLLQDQG